MLRLITSCTSALSEQEQSFMGFRRRGDNGVDKGPRSCRVRIRVCYTQVGPRLRCERHQIFMMPLSSLDPGISAREPKERHSLRLDPFCLPSITYSQGAAGLKMQLGTWLSAQSSTYFTEVPLGNSLLAGSRSVSLSDDPWVLSHHLRWNMLCRCLSSSESFCSPVQEHLPHWLQPTLHTSSALIIYARQVHA